MTRIALSEEERALVEVVRRNPFNSQETRLVAIIDRLSSAPSPKAIRRVEYGYRTVGSTSTRYRGWVDRSRAEAEMARHAAYWPNERYELIEIVTTITEPST